MVQLTHETLNEKAYSQLKDSIISGQVAPGDLLRIRDLASQYGVSPTPIREALKQLVAEHALDVLPNRSIIVPRLSRSKFDELTKIRLALEGLCGELAAPKSGRRLITDLENLDDKMRAATEAGNVRGYLRLNERFHFAIYRTADAPNLLNFIEILWLQIGPFLNNLFQIGRFSYDVNHCHARIIAALKRGDAAAVGHAIQEDISVSVGHLVKFL
jgi:DNA-binding GntR family transcriptional regulator